MNVFYYRGNISSKFSRKSRRNVSLVLVTVTLPWYYCEFPGSNQTHYTYGSYCEEKRYINIYYYYGIYLD